MNDKEVLRKTIRDIYDGDILFHELINEVKDETVRKLLELLEIHIHRILLAHMIINHCEVGKTWLDEINEGVSNE